LRCIKKSHRGKGQCDWERSAHFMGTIVPSGLTSNLSGKSWGMSPNQTSMLPLMAGPVTTLRFPHAVPYGPGGSTLSLVCSVHFRSWPLDSEGYKYRQSWGHPAPNAQPIRRPGTNGYKISVGQTRLAIVREATVTRNIKICLGRTRWAGVGLSMSGFLVLS